MSKNVVQPDRQQMRIRRMRFSCWISKDARAHIHTRTQKYIILITFPLQQWFRQRASKLRHTHIARIIFCSEWFLQYTATISTHSIQQFLLMEAYCVLCDVRTENLYITQINFSLQSLDMQHTFRLTKEAVATCMFCSGIELRVTQHRTV